MHSADNLGYVQEARGALRQRLSRVESIESRISKGRGEKTSAQIKNVLITAILAAGSFWLAYRAEFWLGEIPMIELSRHAFMDFLTSVAFYALCGYWAFSLLRHLLRLVKALRISSYVSRAQGLKSRLQQCIDELDLIAARADQLMTGGRNSVIKPENNFDAELDKCARAVEADANPDERWIDVVKLLLQPVVFTLFSAVVLFQSDRFVVFLRTSGIADGIPFNFSLGLFGLFVLFVLVFIRIQMKILRKRLQAVRRYNQGSDRRGVRFLIALTLAALLLYNHGDLHGWFDAFDIPVIRAPAEDSGAGYRSQPTRPVEDAQVEAPPVELPPTLARGARGDDVIMLQEHLNTLADVYTEINRLTADGDFGGRTETAVAAFQRAVELPPDGVVNEATWRALFDALEAIGE